tara:strand:+ start:183 stop:899 length:717 start_codon:yes stop_codon:yes gene_type:complete
MFREIIQLILQKNKVSLQLDESIKLSGIVIQRDTRNIVHDMKGRTILETGSSFVLELEDSSILKCLKIRHWTEYHKLLLGKNRAKEEVTSNQIMRDIGLNVPRIIHYGIFSNILNKRELSSFYSMEAVPSSFVSGDVIYDTLSISAKQFFIEHISLDLKKLQKNRLVYSDLSLRNLLLNAKGEHYWIDTQVKKISSPNRFKLKFNYSLDRFINNPLVEFSPEEKCILKNILLDKHTYE